MKFFKRSTKKGANEQPKLSRKPSLIFQADELYGMQDFYSWLKWFLVTPIGFGLIIGLTIAVFSSFNFMIFAISLVIGEALSLACFFIIWFYLKEKLIKRFSEEWETTFKTDFTDILIKNNVVAYMLGMPDSDEQKLIVSEKANGKPYLFQVENHNYSIRELSPEKFEINQL